MNIILILAHELHDEHSATITRADVVSHIHQVLGSRVGDTLKVGALGGHLGTATLADLTADAVLLTDITLTQPPPPKLGVTVVLALPRPKVLRRLIMDMTALGVDSIVLINSYRTEKSYWQSPHIAKIDSYVLEGLAQGVDSIPPEVILAKRFKPFVEDDLPAMIMNKAIVAHPYADTALSEALADGLPSVLIIGAEGGFIDYEIKLLESVGVMAASLGSRILRTEAAVNVLLGRWLA